MTALDFALGFAAASTLFFLLLLWFVAKAYNMGYSDGHLSGFVEGADKILKAWQTQQKILNGSQIEKQPQEGG